MERGCDPPFIRRCGGPVTHPCGGGETRGAGGGAGGGGGGCEVEGREGGGHWVLRPVWAGWLAISWRGPNRRAASGPVQPAQDFGSLEKAQCGRGILTMAMVPLGTFTALRQWSSWPRDKRLTRKSRSQLSAID